MCPYLYYIEVFLIEAKVQLLNTKPVSASILPPETGFECLGII